MAIFQGGTSAEPSWHERLFSSYKILTTNAPESLGLYICVPEQKKKTKSLGSYLCVRKNSAKLLPNFPLDPPAKKNQEEFADELL